MDMKNINIILSFCSAAAVFYAIFSFFTNTPAPTKGKKSKYINSASVKRPLEFDIKTYYVLLAIIAAAGVALRLWKFGIIPYGMNQDGAMAAVDAKALADHGTDRFGTWLPAHLYAWGYSQMSSLLSYLDAVFIKLFGMSRVTVRLPLLLSSICGGVFFYLFIRDIFGKGPALAAAAFAAINPWHLLQSRWALDCNLLPHFFITGLFFLNRGLTRKRKHLYISMVFFALCMYCYGIAIYTIPAFLAAACIYYIIKKRLTVKDALLCAAIYLAIAWPFILTMAVNFFKLDTISLPFVTIPYFSESIRANDILLFSDHPLSQLALNARALLNTTILQKHDLPWNDIEGFGTMFIFCMPFSVAGCVEIFRAKTDGAKSLAVFALLTGIWAGLLTNNVNVNRINIVYYGIMIFISLGIYFVISEIKHSRIPFAAVFVFSGVLLAYSYFGPYADMMKAQFFDGFGDALALAEDSGADYIYVTADSRGEGSGPISEILTLFYDKTDALYFQGKTDINNGIKLLPYSERFTYTSIDEDVVQTSSNKNAAYVITDSDAYLFDTNKFEITPCGYGRFVAVTKK